MSKKDIKSMTLQEIEKDFADMSERKFRAKQVYRWLVKSVNNFDDMKNIPQIFRDTLKEKYFIPMKADIAQEIIGFDKTLEKLGGTLEKMITFDLPNNQGSRTLIKVKKTKTTPPQYPRSYAAMKKSPL